MDTDILITSTRTVTAEQLAGVFARSGINRRVHDAQRMRAMAESADMLVTAWSGEQLVGVARSLTDWCEVCYLADLAVDGAYQKTGLGRRLVDAVRAMLADDVRLILLAAPSAIDYYPKIGFRALPNAYICERAQPYPVHLFGQAAPLGDALGDEHAGI
ncbi:MAG: GNAT family N-acetyltransferase [Pseudomonadota bacterium]